MKKIILLIISLVLLLSDFGLSISLAEEDTPNPWIIDSYTAIANINPDGSMDVEEFVTYEFSKGFTGTLKREIDTFAASGIDNIGIYDVMDLNEDDITKSKLEEIKSSSYKVLIDEEYDMVSGMDVSINTEDRQKTVVYKYTLYDLVGIYSDIALLDWSFLNKEDNPIIGDISIKIRIPKDSDMESVKSYLQGPLYTQHIKGESSVDIEASILDGGRDLKLLLLLPVSTITEGRKKIDNEIAEKVIGEMKTYENEIGIVREEYERRNLVKSLSIYIAAGLIVLSFIYIYLRYDKDPKTDIKKAPTNVLPADYYTPAELGVFMNRGKVKTKYIIATLMDLVNRGYLNIETAEGEGFTLSKNPNAKLEALKGHEEYLLVWLFDDFGQGSENVSTKGFEGWLKDPKNKGKFNHKYKTWGKLVIDQGSKWKFFEKVKRGKLCGLLVGIITATLGIVAYMLGDIVKGSIVVGLSLFLMVYSQFIQKRTEFGATDNAKWKGFMKYLKNASRSDLAKPEIDLWESFLAYAIVIDRFDNIVKELPKIYGDNGLKNKRLFLLHKDNLDRTIGWVNSMGNKGLAPVKFFHIFGPLGSGNVKMDN